MFGCDSRPRWQEKFDDLPLSSPQFFWLMTGKGGLKMALSNGHVLTSSLGRVVETDLAGKVVGEIYGYGRVCLPLVRLGFDAAFPADLDLAKSIAYRLKGLKNKNPYVRRISIVAWKEWGPKGPEGVPALIDALNDPDETNQRVVEKTLLEPDVLGGQLFTHMIAVAKDKGSRGRTWAIGLMWKFRDHPQEVVPVLLEALKDKDQSVRRQAANSLGAFGKEKEVLAALKEALKEGQGDINKSEASLARIAAESMRGCGAAAVPALIEAIENPDEDLQSGCIRTLGVIGFNQKEACEVIVPALARLLKDKNPNNRISAAGALATIGGEAKAAVPALQEALKVKDIHDPQIRKRIRANVLHALRQIGPGAQKALLDLQQVLQDKNEDPRNRQIAAEALGNIGAAAKTAIPGLTEALEDEDYGIREGAKGALEKIRSK